MRLSRPQEYGDAEEAQAGAPPRTMSEPGAAPFELRPVRKCGLFECGRFYHKECLAAASNGAFICDSHRCNKCGALPPHLCPHPKLPSVTTSWLARSAGYLSEAVCSGC